MSRGDIDGSKVDLHWMEDPWQWRYLRIPFQWLWATMRDFGRVVWPCRVSTLGLGAILLLFTMQGRELTLSLDQASTFAQVSFFFALAFWIFQGWFWAWLMLKTDFPQELSPNKELSGLDRLIDHWPRIIGIGGAFISALAFVRLWVVSQGNEFGRLAAFAICLAIIAYAFFSFHTSCIRDDGSGGWLTKKVRALLQNPWFKAETSAYHSWSKLPPVCHSVIILTFLLMALAVVMATFWPAWTGMTFGSLAMAFLAFAFVVAAGSMLSFLSVSWRFPADVFLLGAAMTLNFTNLVDNHAVRVLDVDGVNETRPNSRPKVEKALVEWSKALGNDSLHGSQPPLVIVATAGGGLRAAYWTATVLGEIEDNFPGFHKYVFAISGVSGGSLGAAVFDTLVTVDPKMWEQTTCKDRVTFQGRARCILEQDYLGPAVAGAFYPDLLQRFIPFRLLDDRAAATEKGWEEGWRNKGLEDDRYKSPFARPFLALWGGPQCDCKNQSSCGSASNCEERRASWVPALLLNGTHVETGKRIITSNLRIERSIFTDALDVYDGIGLGVDFPISAAVNNSARFPFVEPAGTLRKDGEPTGHIVDGGYFENFGASTAAELLRAVTDLRDNKRDKNDVPQFRPIVIQISSDPDLTETALPLCEIRSNPGSIRNLFPAAAEITEAEAPLQAFFATRNARGIFAARELCRLTYSTSGSRMEGEQGDRPDTSAEHSERRFFDFRMRAMANGYNPGLGWSMSRESFERIDKYIEEGSNAEQMRELLKQLGASAPQLLSRQSGRR